LRTQGHLSAGVLLSTGGKLRIAFKSESHGKNGHAVFGDNTVDNRILALAASVQKAHPKQKTVLVTKDINLRVKADALGLQAEDYENDHVNLKDLYTGVFELQVSAEKIA